MKKLLVIAFVLLVGVVAYARPVIFTVNGQTVTIVPPSDLPTLYSIPTNAILTVTIPGKTNYQVPWTNFLKQISTNIQVSGSSSNAAFATNAGFAFISGVSSSNSAFSTNVLIRS